MAAKSIENRRRQRRTQEQPSGELIGPKSRPPHEIRCPSPALSSALPYAPNAAEAPFWLSFFFDTQGASERSFQMVFNIFHHKAGAPMKRRPSISGIFVLISLASLTLLAGTDTFAVAMSFGENIDDSTTASSLRPELLEDSKVLAAVLNECKKHSGTLIGHAVSDLQKRIGKEMTPRDPTDITTMLRIADDCTSYLSSPGLVNGMELPAAQEARREANNTLQKLNEISRRVVGVDLRSLEVRTREHLQSPFGSRSASVQPVSPSAVAASSTPLQPLAIYNRTSNASDLPGRIPPESVQAIIIEASQEARKDTDYFLSEATSTVSTDLLALQNATMRYPNFASHPLMQSISALKRQLGKSLQPKNVTDVETVTELLNRTLRIFGGSEFAPAYRHVEAETKAISNYKIRQAAIASTASTITEIERTLDQGSLISADSLYQKVATDPFMSRFPPAQHYLTETAVLRKELSVYRDATNVPRVRAEQSPAKQVSILADETSKSEVYKGNVLAATLITRNVAEDKHIVESRLASLQTFEFDPKMYKLQAITSDSVARTLSARLDELNGKLSSARELAELVANGNLMTEVRLLFGDAMEADLRRKGTSISSAQQIAANLSNAIQTHQRQVEEAEARRRAVMEEQQALAGKIVNGALIVVMLEEKFQRTSIMGYQMEATKQRQALRSLIQRERNLLTPQVWKAVHSEFERVMPGLTVYQASATQSLLANLQDASR
jgi:hypothetical protein